MTATYQNMLQEELLLRLKKNRSYSARAMARDVGLSPSYFCQVLNRSRSLKEDRAFDMADRLGWSVDRTRKFVTLIRYEKAKDLSSKKKILAELGDETLSRKPQFDLDADYFEAMSSWHHYAILELTTLDGVVPTASWIAKKLGLTVVETEMAVRRLQRLGALVIEKGAWKKTHSSYTTPDDNPDFTKSLRNFHDGVMKLGRKKLWDDIKKREFGSIVVSTDPKKIPLIKEKIRKFQDEMMVLMENGPRSAVYQMSVQLFRLDREEVSRCSPE